MLVKLFFAGQIRGKAEGREGERTHECPVAEGEELGQWVEWQVVSWALWVMVWRGHLGAGAVEATAGGHLGHWGGAESGSGEHLCLYISIVPSIDILLGLSYLYGVEEQRVVYYSYWCCEYRTMSRT